MKPNSRCAIYTRKSSEEGLEQSFNSLHAQREACEAYVFSQKHEGWHALSAKYDDGGFSGGNMERPGLKKLLDDIAAGKIDNSGECLWISLVLGNFQLFSACVGGDGATR